MAPLLFRAGSAVRQRAVCHGVAVAACRAHRPDAVRRRRCHGGAAHALGALRSGRRGGCVCAASVRRASATLCSRAGMAVRGGRARAACPSSRSAATPARKASMRLLLASKAVGRGVGAAGRGQGTRRGAFPARQERDLEARLQRRRRVAFARLARTNTAYVGRAPHCKQGRRDAPPS